MKRAILIDGNNLLFRSYYATAYSGRMMKNSKGFPTNALFGFVSMINKIINEEKPEYIVVAFDKGKNFRHELYKNYKVGRIETPADLLDQFPVAKKILEHLGIKYIEADNYEADDIIGTFAKMADEDKLYDATIISSDKDLLQLISSDVNVKLLKQKDYILMNEKTFKETYGIDPVKIIDLKSLEGDKSDNIPGVSGIGEKTALSLLQTYGSLENIYENIDLIPGKLKEKLINDKENAFFSKQLATIYKDIDLGITFKDLQRKEIDEEKLYELYEELEFYSFIKKIQKKNEEKIEYKKDSNFDVKIKDFSFYLEIDNENYHKANIIGAGLYDGVSSYYLTKEDLINKSEILDNILVTYDLKKSIVVLKKLGINFSAKFDTMIAAYLLNYNARDDIAYLANTENYNIIFYENIVGKKQNLTEKEIEETICLKAKFLYETKEKYESKLIDEEMIELFNNIEMPLIPVLADMEIEGINVNKEKLYEMKEEIEIKINNLSRDIYNYAGMSFNISSPKQLGEILFERLGLPYNKKRGKTGFSTSHDVLIKIKDIHPIIEKILEYRNLTKLITTYLDTLADYIMEDGKIHTIYKQNITRTGRLSSVEPNLQNIPIRGEEGRKIRKAFFPNEDSIIMTSDYSQLELRILAHISKCEALIDAFNNHEDIHTKVASDIFGVEENAVTKNMRRAAKAVIFGIVYGISGYGLGENLDLPVGEAKKFIDKYLTLYPGVKEYMDRIVIEAKSTGYVRSLLNRKRVIEELNNTNYMIRAAGERIALNTPIQATEADIIKIAMINIYNKFKENKLKSKMILQVHDELVFNVLNEEKHQVQKIVTNTMENAYELLVPLKVETDFGNNWYEAK